MIFDWDGFFQSFLCHLRGQTQSVWTFLEHEDANHIPL